MKENCYGYCYRYHGFDPGNAYDGRDESQDTKAEQVKTHFNNHREKDEAYRSVESKNATKRAKWKTSNKKVATVSKKGKVTAKKKGTAIISVKVAKKTLKCKVVVKDTRKKNSNTTSHKHDYFKSPWTDPQCDIEGEAYYYCRICP
ncbi:hypothetical protein D3Z38_19310 [Clostridiales bacterium]|nr:hypothetical protein [Clostridiales bacterium]